MEHLPLTRPAPWEEIPGGGIETLFPELPPPGARPVEVLVAVTEEGARRVVMDIVAAEDDLPQALAMAVGACRGMAEFKVTAQPFRG